VEPLIRRFTDRRILVGRRFAAMPEWLRVSLGTPQEMQLFVAALRELAPARAAA
jgi:histidinol-phosphate aminotransferase